MRGLATTFTEHEDGFHALGREAEPCLGGYGHGLAADIVSVKGESRMQRSAASEELWKWIDAHEKELGIGRPYLDRDPPHVGLIDGRGYAAKRGRPNVQKAGLQTYNAQEAGLETKKRRLGARNNPAQ